MHVGSTIIILAEMVLIFFYLYACNENEFFLNVWTKRCSSVFTCRICLLSLLNIYFWEVSRLLRLSMLCSSFLCKCFIMGKLMKINFSWWENKMVEYFYVSFELVWISISPHLPFGTYEPERWCKVRNPWNNYGGEYM